MAAKPTDIPIWGTDGGTDPISGQNNLVEPPASKLAAGWHYLEKFPRNWLNWWMNVVYQWCLYVSEIDTQSIILNLQAGSALDDGDAGWDYDYDHWETNAGSAGGDQLILPLPLEIGDEVTAVTLYFNNSASTVTSALAKTTMSSGAETLLSDATVSVGTGYISIALTNIVSDPVSDGDMYFILMNPNTTGTGRMFYGAKVTVTRSFGTFV